MSIYVFDVRTAKCSFSIIIFIIIPLTTTLSAFSSSQHSTEKKECYAEFVIGLSVAAHTTVKKTVMARPSCTVQPVMVTVKSADAWW